MKTALMPSVVLWPPNEEKKEESMNEQREEYVAEATNNGGKKRERVGSQFAWRVIFYHWKSSATIY